jgi:orotidine-5'-phosphate decarboxylase
MTKLIVALDVGDLRSAEAILKELRGTAAWYKIGLELFTAHGRRAVELAHRFGGKVFLDLKLHDIPRTVAHAVKEAQKLGVSSVSLHLSGGADMLSAARDVHPRPELWGVTVLTSLAARDLSFLSARPHLPRLVENLARLGAANGIDATICSGHEAERLRGTLPGLRLVTPGIRPGSAGPQDQKRVMTPAQAAALGIDFIVVGRPITQASDKLAAARAVLSEIRQGNMKK